MEDVEHARAAAAAKQALELTQMNWQHPPAGALGGLHLTPAVTAAVRMTAAGVVLPHPAPSALQAALTASPWPVGSAQLLQAAARMDAAALLEPLVQQDRAGMAANAAARAALSGEAGSPTRAWPSHQAAQQSGAAGQRADRSAKSQRVGELPEGQVVQAAQEAAAGAVPRKACTVRDRLEVAHSVLRAALHAMHGCGPVPNKDDVTKIHPAVVGVLAAQAFGRCGGRRPAALAMLAASMLARPHASSSPPSPKSDQPSHALSGCRTEVSKPYGQFSPRSAACQPSKPPPPPGKAPCPSRGSNPRCRKLRQEAASGEQSPLAEGEWHKAMNRHSTGVGPASALTTGWEAVAAGKEGLASSQSVLAAFAAAIADPDESAKYVTALGSC